MRRWRDRLGRRSLFPSTLMAQAQHAREPSHTRNVRNRLPQQRSGHGKSAHGVDPRNGFTTLRAFYGMYRRWRTAAATGSVYNTADIFNEQRFLVQWTASNFAAAQPNKPTAH